MPEQVWSYFEDSDQWFEHGWRYQNNEVFSYLTDRKEQNEQTGTHYTVEEFFNHPDIPIAVKQWLKEILEDT